MRYVVGSTCAACGRPAEDCGLVRRGVEFELKPTDDHYYRWVWICLECLYKAQDRANETP